jgi:hypothetical protein
VATIPLPAGTVPAPRIPGRLIGLSPIDPVPLRAARLEEFRRIQAERDVHAERCTGRSLEPNPCLGLWSLDERLRVLWAELEFLGVDLAQLYELEAAS